MLPKKKKKNGSSFFFKSMNQKRNNAIMISNQWKSKTSTKSSLVNQFWNIWIEGIYVDLWRASFKHQNQPNYLSISKKARVTAINKIIDKSIMQPYNRSIVQFAVHPSIHLAIKETINQSINQSMYSSIRAMLLVKLWSDKHRSSDNQSINQSINRSIDQ